MPAILVTRTDLARRWSKSPRTIARYMIERPKGFPTPITLGGRWHFRLADVEAYEAALVSGSMKEAA